MISDKLIEISMHARNIINFEFPGKPREPQRVPDDQSDDRGAVTSFRTQTKAAQELVREYLENPSDLSILGRSQRVIEQLGVIDSEEQSIGMRAKVNVAVMSGRMRRTHFSAYIAGKYTSSSTVPDTFKTWLHNVAANGALDFMSCMKDANAQLESGMEERLKENGDIRSILSLLRMFERGAREDAGRFLDLADSHDPNAPLTLYNKARLAAFKERVEKSLEYIREIRFPQQDDHPAWLLWHLDNRSSYGEDSKLQRIYVDRNNYHHSEVNEKLEALAEQADTYIKARGGRDGMWSDEGMSPETRRHFKYTKALIASCGAGIAVLALISQLDPETTNSALAFLQALFENLDIVASAEDSVLQDAMAHAEAARGDGGWASVTEAVMGDGGWANIINYDEGLVAATFGDGGWA